MLTLDSSAVRDAFAAAADTFRQVVASIAADQWDRPSGCGSWTVRELTAHAMRAITLIPRYLDAAPSGDRVDRVLADAVEYYQTAMADPGIHQAVAGRGREAGRALTDPLGELDLAIPQVVALVGSTADDDLVTSAVGTLPFVQYLATRVVELALHTADLQLGLRQPVVMHPVVAEAVLDVVHRLASPVQLSLVLTGRATLPAGYNVLG